tara:strand:- start:2856 stop:3248 length:393 start_codon:yes stop_codon:yes gene_type:complete
VIDVVGPITTKIYQYGLEYYKENPDGTLSSVAKNIAMDALDDGAELVEVTLEQLSVLLRRTANYLGEIGLNFFKYLGPAIIEGVENTYDAIRDLFRGKEDDIVAGFLTGFIAVLTVVYLYQSVKVAGDAI